METTTSSAVGFSVSSSFFFSPLVTSGFELSAMLSDPSLRYKEYRLGKMKPDHRGKDDDDSFHSTRKPETIADVEC